ncbi:MAG: Fur family transcriptional regulator [Gaiellaceae bacterium]
MTTPAWNETALEALKAAGYRAGGARHAVVELLERQECCLSAQEIFDRLRGGTRPVGIASVYRVLEQLSALGLVQRVDVGDATARYEPLHLTDEHHHHLVCVDCGRVEPFTDDGLEQAVEGAAGRVGFAVDGHEVVLRGACGDCRP